MKSLKKLGLIFTAIAFCFSLAVSSSYAQPGKAAYRGNNGKHKGWTQGKHKGWYNGEKRGWQRNDDNRYRRIYRRTGGSITPQEYRHLQRQRNRINRLESRYYRDGSLSVKERRKLAKRYDKYASKYRKAVRNDRRSY